MKNIDRHGDKWRVRWTNELGKRKSKTFSNLKDAKLFYHSKMKEVEEVKRGFLLGFETNKLGSELFDYYIENHTIHKRSQKDDLSIINKHLKPFFGDMLIIEFYKNLDEFKRLKISLSIKTQRNILTLLGTILKVALNKKWIIEIPQITKPKLISKSNYSYLKSEHEEDVFLNAAKDEGAVAYVFFKTAIKTGMRHGELAALTWDDIDFDRRLISVSKSFNGPTKSGGIRYIPIMNSIYSDLLEYKSKSITQLVFPNSIGRMQSPSSSLVKEVFKRTLDRAGFPSVQREGQRSNYYIVFHDLRHTFASRWMMKGGDIFKLQKILGHRDTKTTQVYAHLSPDVYKEDYSRL